MIEYGLIGEKLGHSFSKIIHEKLTDYTYELCPLTPEQLPRFLTDKPFKAINVTIPYKRDVIPFCDHLDDSAKQLGVVNTIVNRDGLLTGYNTDFTGFLHSVRSHGIDMKEKKILILGNGGTCQTISAVARYLGAREILVASRNPNGQEHVISYQDAAYHLDTDVIINASPKGMYPNNSEQGIDLRPFTSCQAVFDVVYNPMKTRLLQQAEEMGMLAVNGLEMLVAQAKFAAEHFLNTSIPDTRIEEICRQLRLELCNISLIGMPSCGKTLTGQALSRYVDKTFVDTDALIVERAGMEIREIFEQHGEAYFRQLEHDVIAELSSENGLIIATGGGAIKNYENIQNLRQNGILIFIDRDLDKLVSTHDRPLSSSKDAIAALYHQRYPLYLSYGDLRIENNYDEDLSQEELDSLMNGILEGYHEIIGHQWS